MLLKTITYSNLNKKQIKSHMVSLLVYMMAMLAVFAFQITYFVKTYFDSASLPKLQLIIGIIVLYMSLMYAIVLFVNFFSSKKILKELKSFGVAERKGIKYNFNGKDSSGNLLRVLNFVVTTIATIVAVAVLTYSVYNFIYARIINFYLPTIAFVWVATMYSCHNIQNNYEIQKI